MSDVTRYTAVGDGVVRFDDQGPLVVWQDYARLQAYLTNCQSEADRLKAEVERLRKAGDAMAYIMAYENDNEFNGFVDAWNAAKEGKQS